MASANSFTNCRKGKQVFNTRTKLIMIQLREKADLEVCDKWYSIIHHHSADLKVVLEELGVVIG